MALFFFVVGLEIKRELVDGELQDRRAAALPAIAAVGGVVAPDRDLRRCSTAGGDGAAGWAIPAATDIAFAVGVLALLGDRVSSGARLFLLSVAIVDDIIAITIIAIFYGGDLALRLAGARGRCSVAAIWLRRPARLDLAVRAARARAVDRGARVGRARDDRRRRSRPADARGARRACEHRLHPTARSWSCRCSRWPTRASTSAAACSATRSAAARRWPSFAGLVRRQADRDRGRRAAGAAGRLGRAAGGRARAASWSGWRRSAGSASRSRCSSPSSPSPTRRSSTRPRSGSSPARSSAACSARRCSRAVARGRVRRAVRITVLGKSPPGRTPTAPAPAISSRAAARPCCSTAGRACSPSCAGTSTTPRSTRS